MISTQVLALRHRDNRIWNELRYITLSQAAEQFVSHLSDNTQRTYKTSLKIIFRLFQEKGYVTPESTVQDLSLANLENMLDCLQTNLVGSVGTKQNRCAVFVSFTRYLHRVTQGMVRIALPKTGSTPTFQKIRDKAKTNAITHEQWNQFIHALRKVSFRDYLIAKMIFQGAKRLTEVLNANLEDVDWDQSRIKFRQLKSNIREKFTIITYPADFMTELRVYLCGRKEGRIFETKSGRKVTQPQLYRSFQSASTVAKLPVNVHPHTLRATAITLLMKMGYHSDQVTKVSGHSTTAQVMYYDKTPEEENITTMTRLI